MYDDKNSLTFTRKAASQFGNRISVNNGDSPGIKDMEFSARRRYNRHSTMNKLVIPNLKKVNIKFLICTEKEDS